MNVAVLTVLHEVTFTQVEHELLMLPGFPSSSLFTADDFSVLLFFCDVLSEKV